MSVYKEEGENLRFEAKTAQDLVRYFLTVELALGAWLTTSGSVSQMPQQWIVFVLNTCFGLCVGVLLWRNYQRRGEVIGAIDNTLKALELNVPGRYRPEGVIHTLKHSASWLVVYLFLIVLFCAAEYLPVFFLAKSGHPSGG